MGQLLRYLGVFARDVILGVLLWLLLTASVGQAREVPTGSMAPTIRPGDRLWADKLTLRFREPVRGDIVVFDPPFPSESPYIKRVVGLPGETVSIQGGRVFVDGQPIPEPYLVELPGYRYGPVTIPVGQYLVLGDNRNESYDSHVWGLVPREAITARAVLRIWPLERAGSLK